MEQKLGHNIKQNQMKNMMESVFIVFAAYNNEAVISSCVKSCLNQSYENIQIWMADGNSSDDTIKEALEVAGDDDRFNYLVSEQHERGFLRNAVVNKAREMNASYIFIIDSDMILDKDCVTKAISIIKKTNAGALVIPEKPFSNFKNYWTKVKVFERKVINNAGMKVGKNSIEAARFWKFSEFEKTGGLHLDQIAFEEIQPTLRYLESGGKILRVENTHIKHDEKEFTLRKDIFGKKNYYFDKLNITFKTEKGGFRRALSRWYFFRPVLYRPSNLKEYIKHPLLAFGMFFMYFILSLIAVKNFIFKK